MILSKPHDPQSSIYAGQVVYLRTLPKLAPSSFVHVATPKFLSVTYACVILAGVTLAGVILPGVTLAGVTFLGAIPACMAIPGEAVAVVSFEKGVTLTEMTMYWPSIGQDRCNSCKNPSGDGILLFINISSLQLR